MAPGTGEVFSKVKPTLVFVGDSITEHGENVANSAHAPGWIALLRSRYGIRAHILNYGTGGYNTRPGCGMHVLQCALASEPNADVVVIFFGANDATISPSSQSVPLSEYTRNLEDMVFQVRTQSAALPILVTPPPICNKLRGPDRRFEITAKYAEACRLVGKRVGVRVIDLHDKMVLSSGGPESVGKFLHDGLHLNAAGNRLLEQVVADALEGVEAVAPSVLKRPFLNWRQL